MVTRRRAKKSRPTTSKRSKASVKRAKARLLVKRLRRKVVTASTIAKHLPPDTQPPPEPPVVTTPMLEHAVRVSQAVSQDKLVVAIEVMQAILRRPDGSEWARIFMQMLPEDYSFDGAKNAEEARTWVDMGRAAYRALHPRDE
jgi:hypothetical protein